ncbi:hypothetical protein [Cetacean poxvirus 1]|nr:hypothetical protein [Cetacean poxvirus 1]
MDFRKKYADALAQTSTVLDENSILYKLLPKNDNCVADQPVIIIPPIKHQEVVFQEQLRQQLNVCVKNRPIPLSSIINDSLANNHSIQKKLIPDTCPIPTPSSVICTKDTSTCSPCIKDTQQRVVEDKDDKCSTNNVTFIEDIKKDLSDIKGEVQEMQDSAKDVISDIENSKNKTIDAIQQLKCFLEKAVVCNA